LVTLYGNDEKKLEEARRRLQSSMRFSRKPVARPRPILYYADKDGIKPWKQYVGE
jgi:hypothetical protein